METEEIETKSRVEVEMRNLDAEEVAENSREESRHPLHRESWQIEPQIRRKQENQESVEAVAVAQVPSKRADGDRFVNTVGEF